MLKEPDHGRPHATDDSEINDVWYMPPLLMLHIY